MITLQIKETFFINWRDKDKGSHRFNRPAIQAWDKDGTKQAEIYYTYGFPHRSFKKPSFRKWYPNGQRCTEEYWENGIMCRYISWSNCGEKTHDICFMKKRNQLCQEIQVHLES